MDAQVDAVSTAGQIGASLLDLFNRGGLFMWPLLLLSIISSTMALYKLFDLAFFYFSIKNLRSYLSSRGRKGHAKMLPFINRVDLKRETHRSLFQNAIQLHFDRQGRALIWFNALGTGASMLGFIGTVTGMISAFDAISQAEQVSVQLTAGGISEALITTGFGLVIAVFCLLVENYFRYAQIALAHQVNIAVDIYLLDTA